ncbi:hypothetical protein A3Q56_05380 [Intoshia linei]|uniref:3'-5' exonuclease domain-containing protein n=1 Tax=Intoshia linei TaxID=1819745 RepID=A0A177AXZ8_9BILA|nr:hypothetical protein A3Q56_05380 [Intoshia linei]
MEFVKEATPSIKNDTYYFPCKGSMVRLTNIDDEIFTGTIIDCDKERNACIMLSDIKDKNDNDLNGTTIFNRHELKSVKLISETLPAEIPLVYEYCTEIPSDFRIKSSQRLLKFIPDIWNNYTPDSCFDTQGVVLFDINNESCKSVYIETLLNQLLKVDKIACSYKITSDYSKSNPNHELIFLTFSIKLTEMYVIQICDLKQSKIFNIIKNILENVNVMKIIHDSRLVNGLLRRDFGIIVNNVYDTQAISFHFMKNLLMQMYASDTMFSFETTLSYFLPERCQSYFSFERLKNMQIHNRVWLDCKKEGWDMNTNQKAFLIYRTIFLIELMHSLDYYNYLKISHYNKCFSNAYAKSSQIEHYRPWNLNINTIEAINAFSLENYKLKYNSKVLPTDIPVHFTRKSILSHQFNLEIMDVLVNLNQTIEKNDKKIYKKLVHEDTNDVKSNIIQNDENIVKLNDEKNNKIEPNTVTSNSLPCNNIPKNHLDCLIPEKTGYTGSNQVIVNCNVDKSSYADIVDNTKQINVNLNKFVENSKEKTCSLNKDANDILKLYFD